MAAKMWTVVLYKANLNGTIVSRKTQHTRNMWTKSYSLLLLVLLFTIVNSFEPQEGKKCVDGKHFFDGCNSCFCVGGQVTACTLKLCHDKNGVELKRQEPPEDFWEKNETS